MATKLSALLSALAANPAASITVELPDGATVPAHFHVTEVGRVRKDFIDCGGTVRSWERCVLQVWVADDREHRVLASKLAMIIGLGRGILGDTDLELEVEYDVSVITQFPVVAVSPSADEVRIRLGGKHTACLAPDLCGVGDSGCCTPATAEVVTLGVRR